MTAVDVAHTLNPLQLTKVFVDQVALKNLQDSTPLPPDKVVHWRIEPAVGVRLASPNQLRIRLEGRIVFQEESPKPFELSVAIVGVYQSKDPISQEDVPIYAQTHSIPLLWPYLRELISDLTSRMGGPTIVAPTVAVTFAPADVAEASQPPADSTSIESQPLLQEAQPAGGRKTRSQARKGTRQTTK